MPDGTYTIFQVDGRGVAGAAQMGADFPADVPSHWQVYFAVDDADAVTAKAKSLGATVISEPYDITDVGRIAQFIGPQGEPFAVIKNATPPA